MGSVGLIMGKIDLNFGEGGANLSTKKFKDDSTLAEVLRDMADDLTELRSAIVALTAKLDVDFTAQNLAVVSSQLDEDYASSVDPAALKTEKV